MELRQTRPIPLKRAYQRHTDQCSGHDWAVVELVLNAGTLDVLPPDAVVCDCDRAAIIYNARTNLEAMQILKCNGTTMTRLIQLGQQLWPTSTQS